MKRNIVLTVIIVLILAILLLFELLSGDYDKTLNDYFPEKPAFQKNH